MTYPIRSADGEYGRGSFLPGRNNKLGISWPRRHVASRPRQGKYYIFFMTHAVREEEKSIHCTVLPSVNVSRRVRLDSRFSSFPIQIFVWKLMLLNCRFYTRLAVLNSIYGVVNVFNIGNWNLRSKISVGIYIYLTSNVLNIKKLRLDHVFNAGNLKVGIRMLVGFYTCLTSNVVNIDITFWRLVLECYFEFII